MITAGHSRVREGTVMEMSILNMLAPKKKGVACQREYII
jgi:hypothetical protein